MNSSQDWKVLLVMGTSPEAPFFVHRGGTEDAEKVCHGDTENTF
ncbi:hypothetical protein [Rhodohalobacter barkolensis]|nr:hypothetical protein [Rhodohalobacter barkolensis]